MNGGADWAAERGDVWARRWRDTDAGLSGIEPHLVAAIGKVAPPRAFRALEVGCGAGTTTHDVGTACPQATITACDLSRSLVEVAKERLTGSLAELVIGDAVKVARERGPFDLIYSRHGVMFFDDPVAAFSALRGACARGAALVFSCFAEWDANPWASELAATAAGVPVARPGREPGGFAFSDPGQVERILHSSGWQPVDRDRIEFDYVAGDGETPIENALAFLTELGPASVALSSLSADQRPRAIERMRDALYRRHVGNRVVFPAAAWIWTASASDAPLDLSAQRRKAAQ